MVQVKMFDCEHEQDLEEEMNDFFRGLEKRDIIDVKYNIAAIGDGGSDQIYCFSAMVLYIKKPR